MKKDVHPHTFRHSFAIHYINNGGNILRLQQLLGHEHIDTTFNYLKYCTIPLTDTPTPLAVMLKRQAGETAKMEQRRAFLRAELARTLAVQEAEKARQTGQIS